MYVYIYIVRVIILVCAFALRHLISPNITFRFVKFEDLRLQVLRF